MNKPRLIDANELIKCIEHWYESCSPRADVRDMVICDTLDSVLQHIDDIPTAYDIDKVVEQIEAIQNFEMRTGKSYCPDTDVKNCRFRFSDLSCSFCAFEKAIEIVKGNSND